MNGHREVPQLPPASVRPSLLLKDKHLAPVSPLECALPRCQATVHSKRLTGSAKPFRMRTYTKTGGRVPRSILPCHPLFTLKEIWSYLQTDILPRLKSFVSHSYKNCRVGGYSSHSGTYLGTPQRPQACAEILGR